MDLASVVRHKFIVILEHALSPELNHYNKYSYVWKMFPPSNVKKR